MWRLSEILSDLQVLNKKSSLNINLEVNKQELNATQSRNWED